MKVFDLCCGANHRFEGWFSSAKDFDDQQARGLISCPACESTDIRKLLSAPRLNMGAQAPAPISEHREERAPLDPQHREALQALHTAWLTMARRIVANTVDVGDAFAEEARKIHYNEAPERAIRGVATPDQAQALVEEGIDVVAFPMPAGMKEPLQ
jgi:hypothetical protein